MANKVHCINGLIIVNRDLVITRLPIKQIPEAFKTLVNMWHLSETGLQMGKATEITEIHFEGFIPATVRLCYESEKVRKPLQS